ncbi:MAG TPA: hypothetical protein V6D02_10685 [Candidatus Obscuribacterales bacterium]
MKAFLFGTLSLTLATLVEVPQGQAISAPANPPTVEQAELVSSGYIYRRYTGGTGRREILS